MKPKQQKTPIRKLYTKEEVLSAIKKLKSRKAPGPDNIPVKALKCFTDRYPECNLQQRCTNQIPSHGVVAL